MAKLLRVNDPDDIEEREVLENDIDSLIDKAEEIGVPFGCTDGRCGSCRVEVVEGMEYLTERTQNELDMGLDESEPFRLICQCKIKDKSSLVKIKV